MEKHGGDIIEVEDDTTAAPGPSQPLFPKLEEEEDEDEVLIREKVDDDGEKFRRKWC